MGEIMNYHILAYGLDSDVIITRNIATRRRAVKLARTAIENGARNVKIYHGLFHVLTLK